jgi:toluene monooxygenase system ferredoxin subunit
MEAKTKSQPVCHVDDLWEGEMTTVTVGARPILLVKIGGEILAYQGWCPHQAHPFSEGQCEDGVLTCGAHLWQFDLTTGQGLNPRHAKLRRFPVVVDESGLVSVLV